MPTTTPTTTTGKGTQVWTVTCVPDCGFQFRTHDQKELITVVRNHSQNTHKQPTTDAEILKMAVPGRV